MHTTVQVTVLLSFVSSFPVCFPSFCYLIINCTQTDSKHLSFTGHIQQKCSTSTWPRRSAYIQWQHQVMRSIKWEIALLESEVYWQKHGFPWIFCTEIWLTLEDYIVMGTLAYNTTQGKMLHSKQLKEDLVNVSSFNVFSKYGLGIIKD